MGKIGALGGEETLITLVILLHETFSTSHLAGANKMEQEVTHVWSNSAVQKIQKLSESLTTTPMVAKLCGINCKNRKITKKIVQTVTPGGYPKR